MNKIPRLTKTVRSNIILEANSTQKALDSVKFEDKDLQKLVVSSLRTMQNKKASRKEISIASAQIDGIFVALKAAAGSGTGVVDCINTCHSEWEKCKKSNSQFLCSLQSIKCLAKCAVSKSLGFTQGAIARWIIPKTRFHTFLGYTGYFSLCSVISKSVVPHTHPWIFLKFISRLRCKDFERSFFTPKTLV